MGEAGPGGGRQGRQLFGGRAAEVHHLAHRPGDVLGGQYVRRPGAGVQDRGRRQAVAPAQGVEERGLQRRRGGRQRPQSAQQAGQVDRGEGRHRAGEVRRPVEQGDERGRVEGAQGLYGAGHRLAGHVRAGRALAPARHAVPPQGDQDGAGSGVGVPGVCEGPVQGDLRGPHVEDVEGVLHRRPPGPTAPGAACRTGCAGNGVAAAAPPAPAATSASQSQNWSRTGENSR